MTVDTDKLITAVIPELDKATIRKPRVAITKVGLRLQTGEDLFESIVQSGAKTAIDLAGRYPLPHHLPADDELATRRRRRAVAI